MKKIFFLVVLCSQVLVAAAMRIEYGRNVTISQPVHEDLYVAGGRVTINAPVFGDLVIAGGTIIINDSIMGDILLAAGTATFNGFAGDDIRCAGGDISISRSVTGDVVVAGGTVHIDKGITIGGLLASGGDITIDGDVNGEIKGVFGKLLLNGTVAKDIDCRGGDIKVNGTIRGRSILAARHIRIGDAAAFYGDVRYWNRNAAVDFRQSVKSGKAVYDPALRVRTGEWYYLGGATLLGLLWYLGMALLMILIIQYLFSATMKKAADTVYNRTLRSLAFGLLYFIAIPVAAIVAFVTIIGVPVGLLLLFSYITLALLATIITSVVAANWINNRYGRKWNSWRLAFAAFGIFILLKLVFLLPFAGWLIMLVMACLAFGGILISINWRKTQAQGLTIS